jgi:phenylacetate-CoA ligase
MTHDPLEYARRFEVRIAHTLPRLAERVPALRERLASAEITPADLDGIDALGRIPVLSKDELLELQAKQPPFGGLLAEDARPRRVFQSPGPLYEPEANESDPWGWGPALHTAGFSPRDVVLNAFGYHLSPAGAMFEQGAFVLGCTVLPGGVGNLDLQARACLDLGVTAFIGLPSYLKALIGALESTAAERDGSHALERAFVTAEPLPASLRSWLRERVSVVRQGYGTAETGNLGYECDAEEGLHVPEDPLVQVCALEDGQPLGPGEQGQVVVTLFREDYPLVRFGTGDLSAFLPEPCPCGLPTPRLAGWLGRVGEAVKVRGMFLHPRQLREAMSGVAGIARYRFVVDRVDERDQLRCELQLLPGADSESVAAAVRERIRSGLRFQAEVRPVQALSADGPVLVDEREWHSGNGDS